MSTNADGATDSDKSREGKMDRHHMKEHPVVMQNIEDTHISSNITVLESSEPGGKVLVYSLLDTESDTTFILEETDSSSDMLRKELEVGCPQGFFSTDSKVVLWYINIKPEDFMCLKRTE